MRDELSALQREILEEAALFADCFHTIKFIVVFGSVARGEENEASDIDIAFIWMPKEAIASSDTAIDDFTRAQSERLKWKSHLEQRFRRKISIHLDHPHPLQKDAAEPAILEAINFPKATLKKAVLAPTPRKP